MTVHVVGGGVAGLVAARRLARGGADVVLHEASDRLGGSLTFHTVGGLVLDAAAESFATRGTIVENLAVELGLGPDVVPPNPAGAWLYRAGGAVRLPATSILGIPGVPLAQDVIDVIGWPAAFRALLDELIPGVIGDRAETLGDLVRRRMGAGVLERLVAPVTLGVHSVHPDDLPVDRAAPGLRAAMRREGSLAKGVRDLRDRAPAGSAVLGIRGGVHRLADELAADCATYGVDVRLGSRFSGAMAAALPEHDVVVWAAPDAQEVEDGTPVELVTLVVDAPELDAHPRGTGLLIAPGTPGVAAKGLTHATAKWAWLAERAGGRHVLRLSYAAGGTPEQARADAETLLGVRLGAVEDADVVRWRRPAPAVPAALDGSTRLRVGEAVAGSGLANVVRQATEVAESVLARDDEDVPDADGLDARDGDPDPRDPRRGAVDFRDDA